MASVSTGTPSNPGRHLKDRLVGVSSKRRQGKESSKEARRFSGRQDPVSRSTGALGPAAQPPVAVASRAFDAKEPGAMRVYVKGENVLNSTGVGGRTSCGYTKSCHSESSEGISGESLHNEWQPEQKGTCDATDKSGNDAEVETLCADSDISDEMRTEVPTQGEGEGSARRGWKPTDRKVESDVFNRPASPSVRLGFPAHSKNESPSARKVETVVMSEGRERRRRRGHTWRGRGTSQELIHSKHIARPTRQRCNKVAAYNLPHHDQLGSGMENLKRENRALPQQHIRMVSQREQLTNMLGHPREGMAPVQHEENVPRSRQYQITSEGSKVATHEQLRHLQRGREDIHSTTSTSSSSVGGGENRGCLCQGVSGEQGAGSSAGGQGYGHVASGTGEGVELCLPRIAVEGGFLKKFPSRSTGAPKDRWFQIKPAEGLLTNAQGLLVLQPSKRARRRGVGRGGGTGGCGKHDDAKARPSCGSKGSAVRQKNMRAACPLTFIWLDPEKNLIRCPPRELGLWEVTGISYGHKTPAFWQQAHRGVNRLPKPECCFSLISGDRTLDVAADSPAEAQEWVSALTSLAAAVHEQDGPSLAPAGLSPAQGTDWGVVQLGSPASAPSFNPLPFSLEGNKNTEEVPVAEIGTGAGTGTRGETGLEVGVTQENSRSRINTTEEDTSMTSRGYSGSGDGVGLGNTASFRPATESGNSGSVRNWSSNTLQAWQQHLFLSVRQGRTASAVSILDEGCPVDLMEDGTGDTALLLACRIGSTDLVEECLRRGARNDPHPQFGQTAVQAAASAGREACMKKILATAALSGADAVVSNHRDPNGEAPLHVASRFGHTRIVEVLLHHGAELGLTGRRGTTALHMAAERGHRAVLACLLDAGGDALMEEGDEKGNRPLHSAAGGGHTDCVGLLLGSAAEPDMPNSEGQTPYDLASNHGHLSITKLIQEYAPAAGTSMGRQTQANDALPRPHAAGLATSRRQHLDVHCMVGKANRGLAPGQEDLRISTSGEVSEPSPCSQRGERFQNTSAYQKLKDVHPDGSQTYRANGRPPFLEVEDSSSPVWRTLQTSNQVQNSNPVHGSLFDGLQVYVVGGRQPLGTQEVLASTTPSCLSGSETLNLSQSHQSPSTSARSNILFSSCGGESTSSTAVTGMYSSQTSASSWGDGGTSFPSARTLARMLHFSIGGPGAPGGLGAGMGTGTLTGAGEGYWGEGWSTFGRESDSTSRRISSQGSPSTLNSETREAWGVASMSSTIDGHVLSTRDAGPESGRGDSQAQQVSDESGADRAIASGRILGSPRHVYEEGGEFCEGDRERSGKREAGSGGLPQAEGDESFRLPGEDGQPEVWHMYYSEGYPYYLHEKSGHSQWQDPRTHQGEGVEEGGLVPSQGQTGDSVDTINCVRDRVEPISSLSPLPGPHVPRLKLEESVVSPIKPVGVTVEVEVPKFAGTTSSTSGTSARNRCASPTVHTSRTSSHHDASTCGSGGETCGWGSEGSVDESSGEAEQEGEIDPGVSPEVWDKDLGSPRSRGRADATDRAEGISSIGRTTGTTQQGGRSKLDEEQGDEGLGEGQHESGLSDRRDDKNGHTYDTRSAATEKGPPKEMDSDRGECGCISPDLVQGGGRVVDAVRTCTVFEGFL